MEQGPKRPPEFPWPPASFSSRQKSLTVFLLVGRARPSGADGGRGATGGGGGGKGPLMGGGGGGGGGGGPSESKGSGGGGGGTPFPASTVSMFSMSWSSSSLRSEKSRSPMQSLGTWIGNSWVGSALGLGGASGSLGSGSRLLWDLSRTRGAGLWGVLGAETRTGSGVLHSSRASTKRAAAVSVMPSVEQQGDKGRFCPPTHSPGCPSTSSGTAPANVSARPWASAACFSVSAAATFSRNRALGGGTCQCRCLTTPAQGGAHAGPLGTAPDCRHTQTHRNRPCAEQTQDPTPQVQPRFNPPHLGMVTSNPAFLGQRTERSST